MECRALSAELGGTDTQREGRRMSFHALEALVVEGSHRPMFWSGSMSGKFVWSDAIQSASTTMLERRLRAPRSTRNALSRQRSAPRSSPLSSISASTRSR